MAQVKALSLGGIGAPCCCGGTPGTCSVTFQILCCSGTADLGDGYTVNANMGGTVIGSGVTAAGHVTISGLTTGTYTIEVTGLPGFAGSTYTSAPISVICGAGGYIVTVPADYCCFSSTADLNGSFAYTFNGVPFTHAFTMVYDAPNDRWFANFFAGVVFTFILWASDCTVEVQYAGCDFRVQWAATAASCDPVDIVQVFGVSPCSGALIGGTLTITA